MVNRTIAVILIIHLLPLCHLMKELSSLCFK